MRTKGLGGQCSERGRPCRGRVVNAEPLEGRAGDESQAAGDCEGALGRGPAKDDPPDRRADREPIGQGVDARPRAAVALIRRAKKDASHAPHRKTRCDTRPAKWRADYSPSRLPPLRRGGGKFAPTNIPSHAPCSMLYDSCLFAAFTIAMMPALTAVGHLGTG